VSEYLELTRRRHVIARLLLGALTAEGIDARIDRDVLSTVYGFDVGVHGTRILVAASDLERARAIVDEVEARGE